MNPILSSFIQERPLTTGGLTFYLLNGKLASRPAKNRKRTRRDREGNVLPARSPAQVQVNDRFRDTRRFARVGRLVRERVGAWRIAAAGTGKTGDNLFHAVNGKACEGGKVVDFAEFHFSVGTLSIPRELRVMREGWRVHLRWEDGRDQLVAAPTDRVMIGYFHDTLPDSPQVFEGPTATRADGECTITIDPAEGRDLHLHVFMARADGTAYSLDRYFFLPAAGDLTGESLSTAHPGGDEPKASEGAPVGRGVFHRAKIFPRSLSPDGDTGVGECVAGSLEEGKKASDGVACQSFAIESIQNREDPPVARPVAERSRRHALFPVVGDILGAPVVPIRCPCSRSRFPVVRGDFDGALPRQYRRFVGIPGGDGVLYLHGPPVVMGMLDRKEATVGRVNASRRSAFGVDGL